MSIKIKPRPIRKRQSVSMESPLIDEQVGEQHSVDIVTRNIHLRTVLELLIGMAESNTSLEFDELDELAGEAFAIGFGAWEGNTDPFVDYEAERNYIGFKKAHKLAGGDIDISGLMARLAVLEAVPKKFNEQYAKYQEPVSPAE